MLNGMDRKSKNKKICSATNQHFVPGTKNIKKTFIMNAAKEKKNFAIGNSHSKTKQSKALYSVQCTAHK